MLSFHLFNQPLLEVSLFLKQALHIVEYIAILQFSHFQPLGVSAHAFVQALLFEEAVC